ncbi:MAG: hypothetical protein ACRYFS_20830 [Janthinobacterium lividum]
MNTLPYALTALATFWSDLVTYPLAIIGTVLFAITLHKLANRLGCYGLPRNLIFGVVSGTLTYVLIQLYFFAGRTYGYRSLLVGELLAGFEVAVVFTFIRRLVFAQRSPKASAPVKEGAA